MCASLASGGEQQFCAQLTSAINAAIAGIYPGTQVTLIQYPAQGDFKWHYQNDDLIFNQGTFDYVSARVSPGLIPGTAQLSAPGGFPNTYVQVISKLAYSLSSTDQAAVNAALQNAPVQAQAAVIAYQGTFGQITQEQMQEAQAAVGALAVQTLQDYVVSYVLGYLWSGAQSQGKPPLSYAAMAEAGDKLSALLPQAPASGAAVVADVALYVKDVVAASALQSKVQMGNWVVAQLTANAGAPNGANGGMRTVDPNTGIASTVYEVGYGVGLPLSDIISDLNDQQRVFSVNVPALTSAPAVPFVSDAPPHSSPLRFARPLSFDLDMQEIAGAGQQQTVTIEYQGYSLIPVGPLAWQQATNQGWFYGDPIAQAVINGTQDVTGFKLLGGPPAGLNLGAFADGGNFGLLTNLLVCNYPKVTINYGDGDFQSFKTDWAAGAAGRTGELIFYGEIKLGDCQRIAYGGALSPGTSRSKFSLSFTPQAVPVPTLQQTAHVIGGTFNFPGASATS